MSRPGDPVTLTEGAAEAALFAALATAFPTPPTGGRRGVAVSGGGDSLALMHLMARAAAREGWALHAVTVDHRLRPEAAEEAALVARHCAALGVPHQVVAWQHGGTIAGNLMAAARQARYGLLAAWARDSGIAEVALAHTADDQAETLLMGLSRAAGLAGLSGMRPVWTEGGIRFHRPLLDISRASLRVWLVRQGLSWADDPSNSNPRYTRVKARQVLQALAPLGISAGGLAETARHLARAQAVLRRTTAGAAEALTRAEAGALRIDRAGFAALEPELGRLLLDAALRWLTGEAHAPRAAALARLQAALAAGRAATLAGGRLVPRGAAVWLVREAKALGPAVAPDALWDGRWRLTGGAESAPGLALAALGAEGLWACPDWREAGLPREVLQATPALWQGETLITAPLAGFGAGWQANLADAWPASILSH